MRKSKKELQNELATKSTEMILIRRRIENLKLMVESNQDREAVVIMFDNLLDVVDAVMGE